MLVSHLGAFRVGGAALLLVQGPRTVGNDLRLEAEIALSDVAGDGAVEGTRFKRLVHGQYPVGAGLFAFYNQQRCWISIAASPHTPAQIVQTTGRRRCRWPMVSV